MSTPIKSCLLVKAAKGDDGAFEALVWKLKANLKHGAFTVVPCDCKTRCDASDEEIDELEARIEEVLK